MPRKRAARRRLRAAERRRRRNLTPEDVQKNEAGARRWRDVVERGA